jgi:hypothetical protein
MALAHHQHDIAAHHVSGRALKAAAFEVLVMNATLKIGDFIDADLSGASQVDFREAPMRRAQSYRSRRTVEGWE